MININSRHKDLSKFFKLNGIDNECLKEICKSSFSASSPILSKFDRKVSDEDYLFRDFDLKMRHLKDINSFLNKNEYITKYIDLSNTSLYDIYARLAITSKIYTGESDVDLYNCNNPYISYSDKHMFCFMPVNEYIDYIISCNEILPEEIYRNKDSSVISYQVGPAVLTVNKLTSGYVLAKSVHSSQGLILKSSLTYDASMSLLSCILLSAKISGIIVGKNKPLIEACVSYFETYPKEEVNSVLSSFDKFLNKVDYKLSEDVIYHSISNGIAVPEEVGSDGSPRRERLNPLDVYIRNFRESNASRGLTSRRVVLRD